ncbi:sugar nucleotide-binding protein [Herbaspirillum sp. GW103]|uniref:sugar nucleotide-binding protein n=1 Tax=Herbaspirillum sp. GW103 TaxID=1175306 RepID=UPI0009D96550|nr:sugar nucleotide-binding protein [Herbaspirillum sp. GW103]
MNNTISQASSCSSSNVMLDGSSAPSRILIVGIDSQIGSALKAHLADLGITTFGTSRKAERISPHIHYLDLEDPDLSGVGATTFDCVIFCAATTSIAQCEAMPEKYRTINVSNPIRLIDRFAADGSFIIYLSSNAVFDGSKPFYSRVDATSPANQYGQFKCEVEQHLASRLSDRSCVLRLTKVITPETPFIKQWKINAQQGTPIRTFSNKLISPVPVEKVTTAITQLIRLQPSGIYQLGGDTEVSFSDYARELFKDDPSALALITIEVDPSNSHITHNSLMTQLPNHNAGKISYSFEGSDLIVASLLRNVVNGRYIDIGANHPTIQNNTYHFYQQGWQGLAVDGNDAFSQHWHQQRPRDRFLTALVSDEVKEVEFVIYPDNTISSMDPGAIKRYSSRYQNEQTTRVKNTTTTLFALKQQYFNDEEIHLLSIDIEGEDFNCLKGGNLGAWQPGVIVIETKNMSLYDVSANETVSYLTALGYRLVAKTPLDAFFVFPGKPYLNWIPTSIL